MKGKKIAALALALALLMGALVAALADGLPDATDTYCPYNALGTHFCGAIGGRPGSRSVPTAALNSGNASSAITGRPGRSRRRATPGASGRP